MKVTLAVSHFEISILNSLALSNTTKKQKNKKQREEDVTVKGILVSNVQQKKKGQERETTLTASHVRYTIRIPP